MLSIKVPATSANFGPGFDTLGVALCLFNELTVEKVTGCREFNWESNENSVSDNENMVLTTLDYVFNLYNFKCPGFRIYAKSCSIPISRGLGSSAASIVAGLYAANYLMDGRLNEEKIASLATKLEGHPDNVITCIEGGMVISVISENGEVTTARVAVAPGVRLVVMVPDYKLSTKMSRSVLPSSYTRADMVYNVSRVALLVSALSSGEFGKLRVALGDRIHQPYRLRLIPGAGSIFEICRREGSLGEFISGAGPTLIAVVPDEDLDFADRIRPKLKKEALDWKILELNVCHRGALIEVV
ncbi:MAG: homoserine kinase [Erysipelotrichaceae bacterium]|nr:homoserine kinase [Erysipelotrichaceae bacterium]